ncbi:hypothetical protein [Flindersiella endophytica]
MSDVTTLPTHGEVFLDARGGDRSLRISWHHESPDGVVVLSLWRSGLCVGSFRLRSREVPLLIDALARGLGGSWPLDGGSPMPADADVPGGSPEQSAPPRQRPRPVPLPSPDAEPEPGPEPGTEYVWPPAAPAAQSEAGTRQPRPLPRSQPGAPPAPPPGPEQRPQHLQPAADPPPIYNDVRPSRRYLGGPPNSSGAESWSA